MIKIKQGSIRNRNGESMDIVVKSMTPNNVVDALIGGALVISGITYLTYKAFKKGSISHEEAELRTLIALGITDPD